MTFESDSSLHCFIDPTLYIANFVDRGKIEILSIDEGRNQFNEAFTQLRIPRHNASLCKGEALECFAPRIVISLKRAQRRCDHAAAAFESQTQIDPVKCAFTGRLCQDYRHSPREPA